MFTGLELIAADTLNGTLPNLQPFKTAFLDYSLMKTLKFIIFALDFN